jgi:hypothetical protein
MELQVEVIDPQNKEILWVGAGSDCRESENWFPDDDEKARMIQEALRTAMAGIVEDATFLRSLRERARTEPLFAAWEPNSADETKGDGSGIVSMMQRLPTEDGGYEAVERQTQQQITAIGSPEAGAQQAALTQLPEPYDSRKTALPKTSSDRPPPVSAPSQVQLVPVAIEYHAGLGTNFDVGIAVDGRERMVLHPNSDTIESLTQGRHLLRVSDPKKGIFKKPDWDDYEIALDLESDPHTKVVVQSRSIGIAFRLEVEVLSNGQEISSHQIPLR